MTLQERKPGRGSACPAPSPSVAALFARAQVPGCHSLKIWRLKSVGNGLGLSVLGGWSLHLNGGAWHWFCSPVFCTLTLVSFVRVLTDAPWPRGTPGRVSPCSARLTPLCILVSLQAVSPVLAVSTLLTDVAARCAEGWGLSCARAPPSGSVPVAMGTVACAWWEQQLLLLGSLGAGHQAGGPLVHAPSTLRASHCPKPWEGGARVSAGEGRGHHAGLATSGLCALRPGPHGFSLHRRLVPPRTSEIRSFRCR
eukprot:bmy_09741T0